MPGFPKDFCWCVLPLDHWVKLRLKIMGKIRLIYKVARRLKKLRYNTNNRDSSQLTKGNLFHMYEQAQGHYSIQQNTIIDTTTMTFSSQKLNYGPYTVVMAEK